MPAQISGMDIFNIVAGVCSVASLVISLWANSKVNKLSQSVTGNNNKTAGGNIGGTYGKN